LTTPALNQTGCAYVGVNACYLINLAVIQAINNKSVHSKA